MRDWMDSSEMSNGRAAAATAAAGLGVSLVAAAVLYALMGAQMARALGDTDDAMRLVMVRALLHGQMGWWDVHLTRLQPPYGMDMHWSRLVDAGQAGLIWLFRPFLPEARAEFAMRLVWPLMWIFPAAWAALSIARRFGRGQAVFFAALALVVNLLFLIQWRPGRIDHHNLQITFAIVALAAAVRWDVRGAVLAGLASALGLAVGLEALVFLGLIGAAFAVRFALQPEPGARPASAYGASLALALTLLYLVQTAPSRWGASACDALGANLWMAVAIAGGGLFALVAATRRRAAGWRLAGLAALGVLAAGAYLGAEPRCIGGPLGMVDPALKPIWLTHISEMQPLLRDAARSRTDLSTMSLLMLAMGAAALFWLGRGREHRDAAWWLVAAWMGLGSLVALQAGRMATYPAWAAMALVAAALADVSRRWLRGSALPGAALICLTSHAAVIPALDRLPGWKPAAVKRAEKPTGPAARCSEDAAFARLAALPPGLVLAEIDLGPFVLADTRHSVMSAPYHRADKGILAATAALSAPPGDDETLVRRMGADYVVSCPARYWQRNHRGLGAQSLQVRLDNGRTPAWLELLSGPKEPLQVYRVRPAGVSPSGAD